MASFSRLKKSKIWVSMLVNYLDRALRFYRIFVAIVGLGFYLIIEKGKGKAIVIEFDSEESAKKWVEENILADNLMEVDSSWTHFYSPYAAWLKEEFNIEVSALIKKGTALPALQQGTGNQRPNFVFDEKNPFCKKGSVLPKIFR
jgi:hypothetical protein